MRRFIDRYEVLLLDVGQTFMFNVDRFDPDDSSGRTYLDLGGKRLGACTASALAVKVFNMITAASKMPDRYLSLPTVRECLESLAAEISLSVAELDILETTIALHEVGDIPPEYGRILHELGKTHRLGIISDIWSRSGIFYNRFHEAGILDLFETIIFSSEVGAVKPASQIFEAALAALAVGPGKAVYIGDSYRRDVCGAAGVGLNTVWINAGPEQAGEVKPDLVIRDLREILMA